jgi:NAD(P)-dependent dehydrogenase (short-subunit alcohol dehydrogenase family)
MTQKPVFRSLQNRTAIVTGGHDGIGFHITQALLGAGARVAILARRQERLEQAAELLGGDVAPIVCDIADPNSVRAAFAAVDERFGALHVLINNAAAFPIFKIGDATDEELRQVVDTNVMGVLHCVRAAVERMRATGGGDIISLSSESVLRPFPYLSAYAATKAAIETLCRGLRSELREHAIRVGVLRSGHVDVPGREGSRWDPERTQAFYREAVAGGFMADAGPGIAPEATARAVLHMLTQPDDTVVDLLELRGR